MLASVKALREAAEKAVSAQREALTRAETLVRRPGRDFRIAHSAALCGLSRHFCGIQLIFSYIKLMFVYV
jgi:hypothetical protein